MKTVRAAACLAAMLLGGAALPTAASAANTNIRCLMLSNVYVNSAKDDQARQAAQATRIFYLGRIPDALSQAQLEAAMVAEGKTIAPATAETEMNRCAALFVQRSNAMRQVAQKVQQGLTKK